MKINKLRVCSVFLITTFLFGCVDGGFVFPLPVYSVKDGEHGANNLLGANDVEIARIDGQTYLFVAAIFDDAVSVFSVADNGILTFVDDVVDGERGANNLSGASHVTTALVGEQTYLFVAAGKIDYLVGDDIEIIFSEKSNDLIASGDDALSIFRVANNGTLTFIDDFVDGEQGFYNLGNVNNLRTATRDGQTYLIAEFEESTSLSVNRSWKEIPRRPELIRLGKEFSFNVTSNSILTFIDEISVDDVENELLIADNFDITESVETAVIGGQTYWFVAARDVNEIRVLNFIRVKYEDE